MMILPFDEELKTPMSFGALIDNGVKYAPASLFYIISMVIGYAGLRYMEVSIVSPVQNASGGLSAVFMTVYFLVVGRLDSIAEIFDPLTTVGTILITAFQYDRRKLWNGAWPAGRKDAQSGNSSSGR